MRRINCFEPFNRLVWSDICLNQSIADYDACDPRRSLCDLKITLCDWECGG